MSSSSKEAATPGPAEAVKLTEQEQSLLFAFIKHNNSNVQIDWSEVTAEIGADSTASAISMFATLKKKIFNRAPTCPTCGGIAKGTNLQYKASTSPKKISPTPDTKKPKATPNKDAPKKVAAQRATTPKATPKKPNNKQPRASTAAKKTQESGGDVEMQNAQEHPEDEHDSRMEDASEAGSAMQKPQISTAKTSVPNAGVKVVVPSAKKAVKAINDDNDDDLDTHQSDDTANYEGESATAGKDVKTPDQAPKQTSPRKIATTRGKHPKCTRSDEDEDDTKNESKGRADEAETKAGKPVKPKTTRKKAPTAIKKAADAEDGSIAADAETPIKSATKPRAIRKKATPKKKVDTVVEDSDTDDAVASKDKGTNPTGKINKETTKATSANKSAARALADDDSEISTIPMAKKKAGTRPKGGVTKKVQAKQTDDDATPEKHDAIADKEPSSKRSLASRADLGSNHANSKHSDGNRASSGEPEVIETEQKDNSTEKILQGDVDNDASSEKKFASSTDEVVEV